MTYFRPTGFQIMPPVVKNLLIINGIFYAATYILAGSMEIDLFKILALHFFTAEAFQPHQMITHIFMHGGFSHILFNMLSLWMFGSLLENFWGSKKFLVFYMICGIGASLTHLSYTGYKLWPAFQYEKTESLVDFREMVSRNKAILSQVGQKFPDYAPHALIELSEKAEKEPTNLYYTDDIKAKNAEIKELIESGPTVGASGAIYGLLMAFGIIFPNMIISFMLFIPLKAKHFVILMIVVGVVFGFAELPGDNIAHFAHLGGMAFGYLMIKYWQRKSNRPFI